MQHPPRSYVEAGDLCTWVDTMHAFSEAYSANLVNGSSNSMKVMLSIPARITENFVPDEEDNLPCSSKGRSQSSSSHQDSGYPTPAQNRVDTVLIEDDPWSKYNEEDEEEAVLDTTLMVSERSVLSTHSKFLRVRQEWQKKGQSL